MEIIKLKSSFKGKVNKIFHMADIHIRLTNDRYPEYKQVFEKVYQKCLKDPQIKNSIILLCGDILHSKNELSPECVDLTIDFFKSLSSITDVILIMGNHDGNLSNKSRLDSLTPLIKEINSEYKIHYLLYSGVYEYNNIYFCVSSIYDQKFIDASQVGQIVPKNSKNLKIALYHGPIHGSITDVGYRMNQEEYTVEHFDGYDFVMLGDVHKFQFLNESKTICYPSSLIQQNYGENIKDHGLVVWDLSHRSSEFINIDNDYGYCHVKIKNGIMTYDPKNIPKKPRIKLVVQDTNGLKVKELSDELRSKFDTQEITYTIENKNLKSSKKGKDNKGEIHKNLQNVNYQNKLIKDYILSNNGIDNKYIDDIIALNTKLNKEIRGHINITNKWKIVSIDFSNMFCYGKDNDIDFSKFNGIVGLLAPNYTGKSSIVDIILFTLFDKCSRGLRTEILNLKKKQFYSRITIEVEGCQYVIMRVGKFPKKNAKNIKIDVSFWKKTTPDKKNNTSCSDSDDEDSNGGEDYVTLNGNDRLETNKLITNLIGTYDDYVTTSFCLQQEVNFIDYSQSKKKDFLIKMLKLNIFDELLESAKLENRSKSILLKDLNNKIKNINVLELRNKLVEYESNKNKNKEIISELNNIINKYHTKVEQLTKKIIPIEESCHDIEIVKSRIIKNEKQIEEIENIINKLEKETNVQSKKVKKFYEEYTEDKVNEINKSHNNFEKNKQDIINKLNKEIKHLYSEKKNVVKFDKTLEEYQKELNIKKEKVKNIQININELLSLIKTNNSKIILLDEEDNILNLYNEYQKVINRSDELERNIKNVKEIIDGMNEQLEKLNEHEYDPNCKYCVNNVFVKDAIKTKTLIEKKKETLNKLNKNLDIVNKKKKLKKFKNIIIKYDEMVLNKKNNDRLITEKKELIYRKDILYRDLEIANNNMEKISNKITKFENQRDDIEFNLQLDNKINQLEKKIEDISISTDIIYITYQNQKDDTIKLEKMILENNSHISKKSNKIDEYITENNASKVIIDDLEKYIEKVQRNNEIIDEINKYKKLVSKNKKEMDKLTNDRDTLIETICYTKKEIEIYESTKDDIQKIEKEANVYNSYVKIIKKDGLPYILLNNLIPQLEEGVNNILLPITNFSVSIENSDGSINLYKNSNGSKLNLELCSGFEKFVVGFGVRISLINLSKLSSCNFMLIDEGFSCMDNNNIKNLTSLFDTIKNMFDFVIVISHLDYVKSLCENHITITVNNSGFSKISI